MEIQIRIKPGAEDHAKTVLALGLYYREALNENQIAMYANDLADLPIADVVRAVQEYRNDPKHTRMPLPAALRAIVRPEPDREAVAEDIASRIWKYIGKRGHNWGWGKDRAVFHAEMAEALGDAGLEVVNRLGGWQRVCEEDTDPGIFRAQLRKIAASVLELARSGRLDTAPGLPAPRVSGVDQIGSAVHEVVWQITNQSKTESKNDD
jgi:hypothetical protein